MDYYNQMALNSITNREDLDDWLEALIASEHYQLADTLKEIQEGAEPFDIGMMRLAVFMLCVDRDNYSEV